MRFVTNARGEVVDTHLISVTKTTRGVDKDVEIPLNRVCSPGVPEYPHELQGILFPSSHDDRGWADQEMQRLAKLWNNYCSELLAMQSRWREATKCYGDIQLVGKTTY